MVATTSTILDTSGNPIKRAELTEPQTSRLAQLHREFASHPSRGLTPVKLARILEGAEQGDIRQQHELFLDMEEKDAHIHAEMGKRKRALLTVDWDIVPPRNASATERKLAGYAKELLQDVPNFEDVILDALDGIGHGFSCQEIEWEMIGREWLPKEISHRPQSWFQTDRETRSQLRLRDMSLDGQALQPFGWVTHVHKAKSGYIARAGLHRVLSWPYLFKNYSVGDLAEFLEIYGLPLRLGKYQSGASDEEKSTLLRAVMSIGHDAAGIIPEGMAIEFQEAAKGASDPFMAMIDWCEKSQSKAILGGTLTSQADGKSSTNALGNVHNEVRHDLMVSDAIQLGGTLTRDLVYPLLALNKGGVDDRRRCPRFKFMFDDSEDLGVLADALPKLVSMGMRIKTEWAHERAGIPQAEEGDEVLGVPKPAASQSALKVRLAALTANTAGDAFPDQAALDAMIESIAPDMLQGQAVAALKPVLDMIAASTDYAEVHAALDEVFPQMDTQQLEETLARAMFVAEVWGRLSAQDGQG
jgi:phage gp29-like protein